MKLSLIVGIALGVLLAMDAAAAQDQSSSGQASAGTSSASRDSLEEIVVTAQRREESLDKVPISVTALSQKTMDDLKIESLSDLGSIVPGLNIPPNGGASNGTADYGEITLRGVLTTDNAPVTQIYIDETPIAIRQMQQAAASMSPQPYIFDLDRVEVLRGPQGTLFGASAMGGAIRFITHQPNLEDSSGFAKADIAYTERGGPSYEVGAAYGAPIVAGKAGFRVSAWYQSSGGFIDRENLYTGDIYKRNANASDSYVIRPAVTFAPSESFTATGSVYVQHTHSNNPNSYWTTGLPNPESNAPVWGGQTQSPLTDNFQVASLSMTARLAGLRLVSDTSYLHRHLDAIDDATTTLEQLFSCPVCAPAAPPGLASFSTYAHDISTAQAWQQELRLSSEDGESSRVNWVAGLQYRRATIGLEQQFATLTPLTEAFLGGLTDAEALGFPDYNFNGQPLSGYVNFHTTDVSEAMFGNVTVNLTARLQAAIGVRVEHTVVQDQHQIAAGGLNGVTYLATTPADEEANPVTPRASLTYQYTDNNMVYATAAKGFRPGGSNSPVTIGNSLCTPSFSSLGLASVPKTFSPDHLWSYELGGKGALINRRLTYEASIYYIDWRDIQTSVALPSCGSSFTANRGHAISKGGDLQVTALVTDDLKIGALLGYTRAYFAETSYGAALQPGSPQPLLTVAGESLGVGSGLPLDTRPWTAALNANYSRDVSSVIAASRGYIRLDYRWYSRLPCACNWPNVANYDAAVGPYPSDGYSQLNLRLGVTHGGLDLSAYVTNATNANPTLGLTHVVPSSPYFFAQALRPRTVGIASWYRF